MGIASSICGRRAGRYKLPNDEEAIAANIRKLRYKLTSIIEIKCGLLPALRGTKVLNPQQIEVIESKLTETRKIGQLIDLVIEMSHGQRKQFLTALDDTQQSHVVEYIRANGVPTENGSDSNWPLRFTKLNENIEKNWVKLIEVLDSSNGLLDEMLSVGCINSHHKGFIEGHTNTDDGVNELLLMVLQRRSVSNYRKFIGCLETVKSYTAVSLLEPDTAGNARCLSAEKINMLQHKHSLLVATMDTSQGPLSELLSAGCITWRQKKFIEATATEADSNTRLLHIIKRGSESDFDTFLDCLAKTGQQHVCRFLMEDGVAINMVAKIGDTKKAKRDEERIVDQFMRLLADSSDESLKELRAKVNRAFDEQLGRDVRLAALDTKGSIRLFYLCKSLAGVYRLRELYSSTVLNSRIEELFTLLLANGRTVSLYSLEWNITDFTEGIRNLCVSGNLPLLAEIHGMPDEMYTNTLCQPCSSLLSIELLPSELVEMLLMKAAGQLFVAIQKMTSRAEAYTVTTLCGVSSIWWRTLTYRQFNKRLCKRYFRHVCRPYKCNPCQLSSISSSGNRTRLAELNSKLYVACAESNSIQVFASRPPFSRLEDITLEGLNDPRDIVVCRVTNQLYIADSQQCAIWRVNLLSNKQVDKFITTQWMPYSLSIKYRRLLITPEDGDALFTFGDDDVQLNRIPLPDYMKASHAVESSRNTYIVSYWKRFIEDKQSHNGVSEFDVGGRIIRQFHNQLDASLQFNTPHYLFIDASNHVIVADSLNERIVLLNPDLQLKRVLIPKLQGQPTRMCFSEETGLLFVGCLRSTAIGIFIITDK